MTHTAAEPQLTYPMRRTCPFDPPPEYARLRQDDPITRVRLWDGSTPWLLTRYEDMRVVLGHPRFSAEPLRPGYPHVFEGRMVADKADKSFLRLDSPEHDRLRR